MFKLAQFREMSYFELRTLNSLENEVHFPDLGVVTEPYIVNLKLPVKRVVYEILLRIYNMDIS
jgi:hypothetical protein